VVGIYMDLLKCPTPIGGALLTYKH
jgi:hypothetical protein